MAGLLAEQRFGITAAQLSVFIFLQLGVYAALQIPTGVLVDRYGPRRLLVVASVVMGSAQLLFATVPSYPAALLARLLLGAGDALTFVSVLRFAATALRATALPADRGADRHDRHGRQRAGHPAAGARPAPRRLDDRVRRRRRRLAARRRRGRRAAARHHPVAAARSAAFPSSEPASAPCTSRVRSALGASRHPAGVLGPLRLHVDHDRVRRPVGQPVPAEGGRAEPGRRGHRPHVRRHRGGRGQPGARVADQPPSGRPRADRAERVRADRRRLARRGARLRRQARRPGS